MTTAVEQSHDLSNFRNHQLKPGSKFAALLRVLLERRSAGLNCFEAVRLANDYTLRSSISALTIRHGVEFGKTWESVPGHGGSKIECVRYRLTDKGVYRARQLLGLEPESKPLPAVNLAVREGVTA